MSGEASIHQCYYVNEERVDVVQPLKTKNNGRLFRYCVHAWSYNLIYNLLVKYGLWIAKLSHRDKLRIVQSFLTRRTFAAIKDSIMEGLLHRSVI